MNSGFALEPKAEVKVKIPAGDLPSPSTLSKSLRVSDGNSFNPAPQAIPFLPTTTGNDSPTGFHFDFAVFLANICAAPFVASQFSVVTTTACSDFAYGIGVFV